MNQRKTVFLLTAAVAVLSLQSCCVLYPYDGASKRSCNCKNQPAIARNDKPVIEQKTQLSEGAIQANDVPASVVQKYPVATERVKSLQPAMLLTATDPVPGIPLPADKRLPLGIKGITTTLIAGPNLSFKSSKEDYGNSNHKHKPGAGLQLGIGTNFLFSEKFAVSTSLLFKHQAAKEVLSYTTPTTPGEPGSNPNGQEYETKYSYSYLSLPVLAQVQVADGLTATGGPELSYLLGASSAMNGGEKESLTSSSVKLGAGVQVGLQYDIPNSPIGVKLTYDQRLSRLNKKSESMDYYPGGSYDIPAWNMKSIQLGVTCELCELMKKK